MTSCSARRALGLHHGDKHCELTREETKVSPECFLEPECHEECVPKQHEKCHNEQASIHGDGTGRQEVIFLIIQSMAIPSGRTKCAR